MRFGPVEVKQSPRSNSLMKSDRQTSLLHYELIAAPDYELKHKRYANERIARPQIDLRQYRTGFCLDFVELEIRPKQHGLNFRDIRRHLKKHLQESVWVQDMSKTQPEDNRFTFRVQEFKPKHLHKLKQMFQTDLELKIDPRIVFLELSLDFRPKAISIESFARMYAVLVRHFLPIDDHFTTRSDGMRMVSPSGWSTSKTYTQHFMLTKNEICSSKVIDTPELESTLGSTVYFGSQNTPYTSWRIMHKKLDKQDPVKRTRNVLPIEKQRSRIEVTLGRHALEEAGLHSLRDLEGLNFKTTFSKFFEFGLPRFCDQAMVGENQLRHLITMRLDKERFLSQGAYRMKQRPLERAMRFENRFKKSAPARYLGSKTVSYREMQAIVSSRLGRLTSNYSSSKLY